MPQKVIKRGLFFAMVIQIFAVSMTIYPRNLENERRYHVIHRIRIENSGPKAYDIVARVMTFNWVASPPYQAILDIKCNPAVQWRKDGEYIEMGIGTLNSREQRSFEVQTLIRHATIFDDPSNIKTYSESMNRFAQFLGPEEGMPVGDGPLKRINANLFSPDDSPKDKARKIFAYVNQRLTYRVDVDRKADVYQALRSGWGRCEDYAMVFVALCRTAGIPSRLVTGLRISPKDLNSGGYANITENLHMWAEVYLPRAGWVSVEPTYDSRINGEKNIDYRFFAGFYPDDIHIYLWYGRKNRSIWYRCEEDNHLNIEEAFYIKSLD